MNGSKPVAAVEIRATHAVDERKDDRMEIPYVELLAEDVVKNENLWLPVRDRFRRFRCERCIEIRRENEITKRAFWRHLENLAKRNRQELPRAYYRTTCARCERCRAEFLIYAWPCRERDEAPRQRPIPRTIIRRRRYSKFTWSNTCPRCQRAQRESHLYGDEFYGMSYLLSLGAVEPNEWAVDMEYLALEWGRRRSR